jgi:hypothetical protein
VPPATTVSVHIPTLPEIVAAIIENSSHGQSKHFVPPPEARYLSNRNVDRRDNAPVQPDEIELDSTSCPRSFYYPYQFVSVFTWDTCM